MRKPVGQLSIVAFWHVGSNCLKKYEAQEKAPLEDFCPEEETKNRRGSLKNWRGEKHPRGQFFGFRVTLSVRHCNQLGQRQRDRDNVDVE